jgi:hypothetical protein
LGPWCRWRAVADLEGAVCLDHSIDRPLPVTAHRSCGAPHVPILSTTTMAVLDECKKARYITISLCMYAGSSIRDAYTYIWWSQVEEERRRIRSLPREEE